MKKVFLSLAMLVGVYTLVASTAVAMFLPQAQVNGITLRSAVLNLLVSDTGGLNPEFYPQASMDGNSWLKPGANPEPEAFWLKSDNDANQTIYVTARVQSGGGDWELLKDVMTIKISDFDETEETETYSLAQWQEAKAVPLDVYRGVVERRYLMWYGMLDTYPTDPDGAGPLQAGDPVGNELMDKTVTDLQIVFEGNSQN